MPYFFFFSGVMNREPSSPFCASNGVRQGDPLSPYLFLIRMEGRSCLIKKSLTDGLITPAHINNESVVSHILYVDDILLFAKSTVEESVVVKDLLEDFAILYGLRMNPSKSHLIVGRAYNQVSMDISLNIEALDLHASYLGLPLFTGRLTKNICSPLINKVRQRLENWKASTLSFTGRVELIISTLSSFHLFWSMAFPLPFSVLTELDKVCRQFLWVDTDEKRKIHMISWDCICLPKTKGGLGIRKIKEVSGMYDGFSLECCC